METLTCFYKKVEKIGIFKIILFNLFDIQEAGDYAVELKKAERAKEQQNLLIFTYI